MVSLCPQTWRAMSLCLLLALFPILIRGEESVSDAGQTPTQSPIDPPAGALTHFVLVFISSAHQQEVARLLSRLRRHLCHRLSVRRPASSRYPDRFPTYRRPICSPAPPLRRRTVLSPAILCEVRTLSGSKFFPCVVQLMAIVHLHVKPAVTTMVP
jgi:hypothetical protein